MTRDELKKIIEGITDEQLKAILDINSADIGKSKGDYNTIKSENEKLKGNEAGYKKKINELLENAKNSVDYKNQLEELQKQVQEKEDADKRAKEDAELTSAIEACFGEKKFSSDYVRTGIIADMKTEIAKPENKGKGYTEIFETLTKDKEGIFANPNPPAPMPGLGPVDITKISDDAARAVMGLAPKKE